MLHLLEGRNANEDDMDITESNDVVVLKSEDSTPAGSNDAFLRAELRFKIDDDGQELCVVKSQGEEIGVMMGWERPISEWHFSRGK
jgi:protein arginine N-methyltransferase 2